MMMNQEDGLPQVAGRMMLRSHYDFERFCRVLISEEQEKINPDNGIIDILSDAVRLSREYVDNFGDKWEKTA